MEEVKQACYSGMSDEALISLLFSEEDRLPMAAVKEATARGKRLIPGLSHVVCDRKNWTAGGSGWWAAINASFILGTIGGEESVKPLIEALFFSVESNCDWVYDELPSIFGAIGSCAIEPLKKIASNPVWHWHLREKAMGSMAAITISHPERGAEVFSFIGGIAADDSEDSETPVWAGMILLDFAAKEYKPLLMSMAESGAAVGYFRKDDVKRACEGVRDLRWYKRDWLSFYHPEEIAERQARWERDRLDEDKAWADSLTRKRSGGEPDPAEFMLSQRGALDLLSSYAGLVSEIREWLDGDWDISPENLRKEYDIADRLCRAIRKHEGEKAAKHKKPAEWLSCLFKGGNDRAESFGGAERALMGKADSFLLFDTAIGLGELSDWLLPLPPELADNGMSSEGAALARELAGIIETEADNFLGELAIILAEAGRVAEAREQIRENQEHFPDDAWVRIKAGDAFLAMNDIAEAERTYRTALEMPDMHKSREGALERLVPMLRTAGKDEEANRLEAEQKKRPEESMPRFKPHVRESPKIGRNEPCPCGSGKKFKKCCGR